MSIHRDRACFTHADIERLCREAEFFSRQDKKLKEQLEAKNLLESKVADVRFYLEKISLDQEERNRLGERVREMSKWVEDNPKATTEEIQEVTSHFERQNQEILEKMKIRNQSDLPQISSN
jgi:molecular chaperone DnaK (HSP70)